MENASSPGVSQEDIAKRREYEKTLLPPSERLEYDKAELAKREALAQRQQQEDKNRESDLATARQVISSGKPEWTLTPTGMELKASSQRLTSEELEKRAEQTIERQNQAARSAIEEARNRDLDAILDRNRPPEQTAALRQREGRATPEKRDLDTTFNHSSGRSR